MLNKLKDPRWRGVFVGLIAGLLMGILALTSGSGDDTIKSVNFFIFSVGLGLSFGSFVGFLIAAGTNLTAGANAALFCGLFLWPIFLLLAYGIEKEITFLFAVYVASIASIVMIITYSLAVLVVIGAQRTKTWRRLKNWLKK